MDPLCHTLVGAALGCTGLQNKTRYSRVTLIVAANLPDIDVVAHFLGETASYEYRRGITHGIPALIVLPFLLAALVYGWSRLSRSQAPAVNASFKWLLILSLIGVWSHPTLDWMNTYGMRWLMPLVDHWFYGDTLFILDWVAWTALLIGVVATRFVNADALRWFARPGSVALAFLVAYVGVNYVITQQAVHEALRVLAADPPKRILASPVPFNPFRRELVFEYDDEYRFANYKAFTAEPYEPDGPAIPRGNAANLEAVRDTLDGRRFMHWARFPYSTAETRDGKTTVVVADARYVRDVNNPRLDGFAILEVTLESEGSGALSSRD